MSCCGVRADLCDRTARAVCGHVRQPSENPDETAPHFPDGTCACAAALAAARDLGVVASHQQVEIPLASATVTQHDLHAMACACGKVHQAARPGGVSGGPSTVSYGPALQALCVFLMVARAVPVHRCAELIESLTGARPSAGFVHAMLARAATAVADANKAIRTLIILAHVVCADETPIRVGPGPKSRRRYLPVACTKLLTCYLLGDRSTGHLPRVPPARHGRHRHHARQVPESRITTRPSSAG